MAFAIAPAAENFLGKLVAAETVAQDESGLAHHQFEQVELLLQKIEQMLLQGSDLDQIVDAHRVLLAEPVKTSDALLDLHRIPGQIEIDQAMAELKVPPLGAAAAEQEGATR